MGKVLSLKAIDTINGAMGRCYAKINGSLEEMIYATKVNADVEKNMKEIPVLGYNGQKNKSTGWKGTGTITAYYITSLFRKLMLEYMNTGKDFYMDLYIENEDPSSGTGKQKIWLKNVTITKVTLAMLDVTNTELNEEMPFVFDGAELIEGFDTVYGE
jgi:hypothetical protein|nr:MAG TPA: tail tube protein [Caudoviricetes sp.]